MTIVAPALCQVEPVGCKYFSGCHGAEEELPKTGREWRWSGSDLEFILLLSGGSNGWIYGLCNRIAHPVTAFYLCHICFFNFIYSMILFGVNKVTFTLQANMTQT